MANIARGAVLQSTNLLLALKAGEPYRVARALALEAAYTAAAGGHERARALIENALTLSLRMNNLHAIGLTRAMAATCYWNAGRWRDCCDQARIAAEVLRNGCRNVTWDLDTANIFDVDALRWMGDWREMQQRLPPLIADARARGDLYAETILQLHCGSCAAMAQDDPTAALEGLRTLDRWENAGFHLAHLIELHNQVEIALYRGDGKTAFAFIEGRWAALKRSLLLHVQALRIQMLSLRARAAIGAAWGRADSSRETMLKVARRDAWRLRNERLQWARMLASLIEGSVFSARGLGPEAVSSFKQAERAAESVQMGLHRATAILAGAQLTRDVVEVERACALFNQEDIRNPLACANVFAPGILPDQRPRRPL